MAVKDGEQYLSLLYGNGLKANGECVWRLRPVLKAQFIQNSNRGIIGLKPAVGFYGEIFVLLCYIVTYIKLNIIKML